MQMVRYSYVRPGDRKREFPILAQDPDVQTAPGVPLIAKVKIPNQRIDRGPRTRRFEVVDYDTSASALAAPIDLEEPRAVPGAEELAQDAAFHVQNALVIAARTLETFEAALGRRVPWGLIFALTQRRAASPRL